MKYIESKRYTLNHPPTGTDIAQLIKDNELYGYTMDIQRRNPEMQGFSTGFPSRVYDIIFEREVDK